MAQMGWLAWIVTGLIAGWLASMVVGTNLGCLADMIVGVVGAMIGGFLFQSIGERGVTGFNLWSIFVSFVGAAVLLLGLRLVTGRRTLV